MVSSIMHRQHGLTAASIPQQQVCLRWCRQPFRHVITAAPLPVKLSAAADTPPSGTIQTQPAPWAWHAGGCRTQRACLQKTDAVAVCALGSCVTWLPQHSSHPRELHLVGGAGGPAATVKLGNSDLEVSRLGIGTIRVSPWHAGHTTRCQ